MGSTSLMPAWSKINKKQKFIDANSFTLLETIRSLSVFLVVILKKLNGEELIEIWDINFKVAKFEEHCSNDTLEFKNVYHVDAQGIVRRSLQYHSDHTWLHLNRKARSIVNIEC